MEVNIFNVQMKIIFDIFLHLMHQEGFVAALDYETFNLECESRAK